MAEPELTRKVEQVEAERAALLATLAPRRAREAKTLAALEARKAAAGRSLSALSARLVHDTAALAKVEAQRAALGDQHLSRLALAWARIGEPLALSSLLLAAFLLVGFGQWSRRVLAPLALGAGAGAAAAWVWRRRRG